MEINSTKLRVLSKVVATGADTEKKISALTTAEIFQIIEVQKIPAKEMGLILELQNAIKNRGVIAFLTDGKDKEEKKNVTAGNSTSQPGNREPVRATGIHQ